MDHQDPGTWTKQDSMDGKQVITFSLNAGVSQKKVYLQEISNRTHWTDP